VPPVDKKFVETLKNKESKATNLVDSKRSAEKAIQFFCHRARLT
jgi:hypothetical protein